MVENEKRHFDRTYRANESGRKKLLKTIKLGMMV